MSKKLLAVLIAAILSLSILAGCKKDTKPADDKTTNEETKDQNDQNTEEKKDDQNSEDKKDDQGEATDETPDADQHINTFIGAWPNTFDPATGSDMYGNGVLLNTLEPLIRVDEDKDGTAIYVPGGAESWDVSEDGLTYTFHVREGMKWSDGTPLTAEDYAYGVRRSADPKTASEYANLIYLIKNGEKVNKGEMEVSELGVKVEGNDLIVELENPTAYFIDTVCQRIYFPQRKDMVEKLGDQYGSADIANIPFCGPFIIKDMTINNEIVYEKNKDYWNADNVKLETINVQVLKDPNTINNALLTGELDYAGVSDPKWQQQLADTGEYKRVRNVNPWTGYFMMNFNKGSKVASTKITRAIAAVIDRQEVIDNAWNGTPIPAWSFVPPTISCQGKPFNVEGEGPAKDIVEDVKDPKALFEEGVKELGGDPANYTIKFRGSDTSAEGRIAIEAFQQQIEKALGCKVEATQHDWNEFMNLLKAGDFDICWLAWGADFNDPSNFLETAYSKTRAYPTGWVNEKFDSLIEEAQKTNDAEARVKALKEAERILIFDDAALIPINHAVANVFRRNYIRGERNNYFVTMGFQTMYTVGRDN